MKRLCLALLTFATALDAHAVGRLADVSIVDQESGAEIPTHFYKGEYWVAGKPGSRYAISIRNALGERLLAVTSVDGINVLSGDTANWNQTGYVFAPRQGYQIKGWRKSNTEVAAFVFTSVPDAYAARTGRPENIGVLGVALFRERGPVTREYAPPPLVSDAPAAPAPLAAPSESAGARMRSNPGDGVLQSLGTGHGSREYSYVRDVDFERLNSSPDEIIRIRYDSLENLIAMGVVARPPYPSTSPEPFPDSPMARYVPDPPAYHWPR